LISHLLGGTPPGQRPGKTSGKKRAIVGTVTPTKQTNKKNLNPHFSGRNIDINIDTTIPVKKIFSRSDKLDLTDKSSKRVPA
jgi:hypothetical protein